MNEKHHISPETAAKALEWIKTRGGLAIWQSVNLSNPGASWSTPATILVRNVNGAVPPNQQRLCPKCLTLAGASALVDGYYCEACKLAIAPLDAAITYPKPSWECEAVASRVITDPADVVVDVPAVYRRFKVAVRRSGNGLQLKLTDSSSQKLKSAVEKCVARHKSGWYVFDYETQEAIIQYASESTPLDKWKEKV
jgi:hypothetical protein